MTGAGESNLKQRLFFIVLYNKPVHHILSNGTGGKEKPLNRQKACNQPCLETPNNMSIIAFLGKDVNEYLANYLSLLESMEFFCKNHPGHRLAYHGTYTRSIKETGEVIPIQRLICYECKKAKTGGSTSILPDFLKTKKQYSATEINSVIEQSNAGKTPYDIDSKASVSTVRRWLREISTQDRKLGESIACIILTVPAVPLSELPSAFFSISPLSDYYKVSTAGYFDYGVWLIAPIEELYSIAP